MVATFKLWEDIFPCDQLFQKYVEMKSNNFLVLDVVKQKPTLRSSCGFSDPGYTYFHNGGCHEGRSWPLWLLNLRNRLALYFYQPFEFALLTEFPSGNASLSNTDNEPAMVEDSKVVCVSFGQTQTLEIWEEKKRAGRYQIKAGSVYSMEGDFQKFLKHGITQAPNTSGVRICITFRHLRKLVPGDKVLEVKAGKGKKRKKSPKVNSDGQLKKSTHKDRVKKKAGRDVTSGTPQ